MRVGLDIGGTKVDAVAVDDRGRPVERMRVPSGFGPVAVIETAATAVAGISALTGVPVNRFDSVGIGIPGMVNRASGRVDHAVNLGIEHLELGAELIDRLGIDVRIENDVRAAALGASNSLGGHGTMAYLNVGSGMAAAIVMDGRLWTGGTGIASEIGHLPVDPAGVLCGCGQRGCLETVASGFGVARQWHAGDPLPVRSVFDAADAGDPKASRIRAGLAEGIASAVRTLVLTVDADTVVIGGGVSRIGQPLLADIQGVLTRWGREAPFLGRLDLPGRVQLLTEGSPVAAIGAALIER
ncbi:ROK family protein [Leifsonia sp. NPDC058248]|uniref:ROK family protein n=1 Tax=Leifsonia sp. NPDC058248 TaxID=3346402 RepID=UPI0036DCE353